MKGMIPAAPIRRLIEAWTMAHPDAREILGVRHAGCLLGNTQIIAALVGVPANAIKDIRSGRAQTIHFDRADMIVTRLSEFGGMGWHQNEELREIYQTFSLRELDEIKPTTRVAA